MADMVPLKGHRLASCVAFIAAEKQGHCQVCAVRSRGPKTPNAGKTDTNLDLALAENSLAFVIPNIGGGG